MHAGRHYTLKEVLTWTRRELFILFLMSVAITVFYVVTGFKWLIIPWLPVALIGTAVAFIVGFKNNTTYNRLWEARQIWGAIINSSRTWAIMIKDFMSLDNPSASDEELKAIRTSFIYRHLAWVTALRFQLREPRIWENLNKSYNLEFRKFYSIPEYEHKLETELAYFLSEEELKYVLSKRNKATHIIGLQSEALKKHTKEGLFNTYYHIELEKMLEDLYSQQGKCERIKNFPYPRQFATLNLYFVRLFILLVPFGMLQEFEKLGEHFVWLTIPFSTLVCWVFHTMEKIGEATENPFEGTPNDIPMAALSRNIEIDLREMLDEKEIPAAIQPVNNILM